MANRFQPLQNRKKQRAMMLKGPLKGFETRFISRFLKRRAFKSAYGSEPKKAVLIRRMQIGRNLSHCAIPEKSLRTTQRSIYENHAWFGRKI